MLIRSMIKKPAPQQGAVLIISLIFLLIITLLGITAMQTTTLDTKMLSNYKSYRTAFEGVETAVMEGECRLIPSGTNFVRPKVGGNSPTRIWLENSPCTGDSGVRPAWWFSCGFDWWQDTDNDGIYAFSAPFYGLEDSSTASRPRYLFEGLQAERDFINVDPQPPQRNYYRITARGSTGPNSQSSVMVQTVFGWRYPD